VLRSAPISYVKWDMNRHLTEVGSLGLPAHRQGEAAHRSRQRRAELLPGMQPAEQQDLIKRLIDFISTLETPDPR